MIDLVANHRQQIAAICKRLGIHRLDVFGSAVSGRFDAGTSDVDFIVEFDQSASADGLLDRYLELAEQLESLLGTAVDIITPRSLRNRYFIAAVNSSRETVYAS